MFVLYKKKLHGLYREKKKISSLYRAVTTICYLVYMKENFFPRFIPYTNKNQRSFYLR